jgi:dsDNA-binding SOS-regulon protein
VLQFQKQQEDSAMLLVSNKQQYEKIAKNRKTQQDRQNTQQRTAGKNKDQLRKIVQTANNSCSQIVQKPRTMTLD